MWAIRSLIGVLLANALAAHPLQDNAFTYVSQPGNHATCQLTLGGYRTYNPCQGQFLKQDSYSPFLSNQTLNGFNYVAGNPVFFGDNTGHMMTRIWSDASNSGLKLPLFSQTRTLSGRSTRSTSSSSTRSRANRDQPEGLKDDYRRGLNDGLNAKLPRPAANASEDYLRGWRDGLQHSPRGESTSPIARSRKRTEDMERIDMTEINRVSAETDATETLEEAELEATHDASMLPQNHALPLPHSNPSITHEAYFVPLEKIEPSTPLFWWCA